jgi:hypothetical protein
VAGGGIPREVERFVRSTIGSVQQLEVLLLLRSGDDRAWTAADVSRTLKTNRDAAEGYLLSLEGVGLLARADDDPPSFLYRPGRQRSLVDDLARVYPSYRSRIVGLIYSTGNENVEAFADAFRLRRRKEDE